MLDLRQPDRDQFRALVATADVLLESTPRGELDGLGLGADTLRQQFPTLIVARMSPFGDDGPWADFKGSDLIHLALGGVMMNCGYDPAPDGQYDLPPIAPRCGMPITSREAACHGDYRGAALSLAHGAGPETIVRHSRGRGEVHRGRPHDVGHAPCPGVAPDLPACRVRPYRPSRPLSILKMGAGHGESGHTPW